MGGSSLARALELDRDPERQCSFLDCMRSHQRGKIPGTAWDIPAANSAVLLVLPRATLLGIPPPAAYSILRTRAARPQPRNLPAACRDLSCLPELPVPIPAGRAASCSGGPRGRRCPVPPPAPLRRDTDLIMEDARSKSALRNPLPPPARAGAAQQPRRSPDWHLGENSDGVRVGLCANYNWVISALSCLSVSALPCWETHAPPATAQPGPDPAARLVPAASPAWRPRGLSRPCTSSGL